MAIIAKSNGNSTFEIAPAGNHVAICFKMVEIGTVQTEWQGVKKTAHKVRLSWELSNEKTVFDAEKGEEPFVISKTYTLSMHEKATLRKDLESWRGKSFSEKEAAEFDITKLLGIPCLLNVIHKEYESKTYANIASITTLPKGMQPPVQVNPSFEFSHTSPNKKTQFENLTKYEKELISATPEYESWERGSESLPETHDNLENVDDLPF